MSEDLVRIETADGLGEYAIDVPARLLMCPKCHKRYSAIDTTLDPWVATCPKGHEWAIQLGQLT